MNLERSLPADANYTVASGYPNGIFGAGERGGCIIGIEWPRAARGAK